MNKAKKVKAVAVLMLSTVLILTGTGCGAEANAGARPTGDAVSAAQEADSGAQADADMAPAVQMVGFIENNGVTSLELFDVESNEFRTVKEYPLFPFEEECTATADGGKVAYTQTVSANGIITYSQWDDPQSHRKLVVEDVGSGVAREYYAESGVYVSNPQFFSDGRRIAFNKTVMKDDYPQQSVRILDIETGEEKTVASGVWRYDVASGKSERVYAAKDRREVGRVSVSQSGRKLLFAESLSVVGDVSPIITSFDLESREWETVIEPAPGEYENIGPVFLESSRFTYLSKEEYGADKPAARCVYDLESGERNRWDVSYGGEVELLRGFSIVSQNRQY